MAVEVNFNDLPHEFDFSIRQGATIEKRWQLKIEEEGAAAAVIDLTGCTLKFTVEDSTGTEIINSRAITPDSSAQGKFTFRVTAADTATWDGSYVYEVECTWPSGHTNFGSGAVKEIVRGNILVMADVED